MNRVLVFWLALLSWGGVMHGIYFIASGRVATHSTPLYLEEEEEWRKGRRHFVVSFDSARRRRR